MNLKHILLAILGAIVATIAGTMISVLPSMAATPQCSALPGPVCGSWNAEVPNLPDLDVSGASANSGTSIIVFTRTSTDKAEDFSVQNVNPAATSKYTVGSFTMGTTTAPAGSVVIQYAPKGVLSGMCVSTVNPDGFAAAQLRPCSNNTTQFNPFQTFTSPAATGDFTAVQFKEVINGLVMTDPANNGSIGTIGHRIHVTFMTNVHATGQFWGQNGS